MTGSPDLQECLKGFFQSYLIEQRDVSPNTLISYRDAFKLLIEFVRQEKGAQRALKVTDLDPTLLLRFLNRLEDPESGRGNSASTRNSRLAAIRSFFQYLAWNYPSLAQLPQSFSKSIDTQRLGGKRFHYILTPGAMAMR